LGEIKYPFIDASKATNAVSLKLLGPERSIPRKNIDHLDVYFKCITWPSPAGMECSGFPVRVYGIVL
jgi:hypothetical protein